MVTAYTLPYGFFQLAYGPLADRFGRLRVVSACMTVFSIGTFSCGLASNLPVMDLLRFITGAAAAAMFPLALAFVGEVFPYQLRQGALGTLLSATATATALSTAIGGVIANFLSWRVVFVIYGLVSIALVPGLLRQHEKRAARPDASLLGGYLEVFRNPAARALLPGVFVEGILLFGPFSFLGAYLTERFNLAVGAVGLLLGVYGLTTLGFARFLGRLADRLGERTMLLTGAWLAASSYLLTAIEPVWWLFPVAMVLNGAGYIGCHTTLQTRATELAPGSRGTGVATFAFVLFAGMGVGTALEGSLAAAGGYVAMLLVSAGALFVFGIWLAVALGQRVTERP